MTETPEPYRDGDRVRDIRDRSTGTVRMTATGAEVHWDDSLLVDELADHITPYLMRI